MIDGGLRPLFREKLPEFHWNSIESGGTASGIPDSEFCVSGISAWLEFKMTETDFVIRKKTWPLQIAWMGRRGRAGGRVYIAIRKHHDGGPRRGGAVDELWLTDGRQADALDHYGLRRGMSYVLGVWSGGRASWDWARIREILSA